MPEIQKLISTGELSRIIGKSTRTIQNLAKDGALTTVKNNNKNQYDLYTVVKEYIDYMTKKSMPKASSLEEEKTIEEIRFKRAKADKMELELKELDGQLHSAEDVESMTTDLVLAVRSALLSLPGRLGVDLAEVDNAAECSEVIKKAICEVLEDLSRYEYNPEEYKKRVRERQGLRMDIADAEEDN